MFPPSCKKNSSKFEHCLKDWSIVDFLEEGYDRSLCLQILLRGLFDV